MGDETSVINRKQYNVDFSDGEENKLSLYPTPTSSFTGHEKYKEKV